MTQLDKFNFVHLACHAVQDSNLPLNSSFHLQDGQLRLSEIIKKNTTADFAFLSACQTSTGDEKLSEEVVHLAAGMLVAGYRGVVATMWSIQDKHCPQISEDFYTHLLSESKGTFGPERAAYAMHYAVQRLQKKLDNSDTSLLAWVPYVHYGL